MTTESLHFPPAGKLVPGELTKAQLRHLARCARKAAWGDDKDFWREELLNLSEGLEWMATLVPKEGTHFTREGKK